MYQFNIELISMYIKDNNLSKKEFCKKCNVSMYALNKIYSGDLHISVKTWIKIADFLKVDIFEVLKRIYF